MKRFAIYGVTLTLNNYKSAMFSVMFLQYVNRSEDLEKPLARMKFY